jgi:hypothetical protein
MKLHELTASSSESINESPTKRNNLHRYTRSSRINNSLTTDSCSQSPSSFENLAPIKTIQSSTNYMHTMNVYHQHSTAFQQHYSGLNF